MRRFCWFAIASVFSLLAVASAVHAQFVRDHEAEGGVRGFHGHRSIGPITRSFQSDDEARAEFVRILSAIGLGFMIDRITLRATAQTPNAEAGIGKNGERFIFYNANFMQRVKQRTAEHWSPVSILAHEVGHHLAFHTVIEGRHHEFELEADFFSGFILRRLGATLAQAEAAMREISPKEASLTHPGLDDRLQAITIGWTDGGVTGVPPGLNSGKQAAEAAKKKADEEARAKAEAERQRIALLQQKEEERKRSEAKRKADEETAKHDPQQLGGWIGVDVSAPIVSTGVLVAKVYPNSPAAKAGIEPDDLILTFDGLSVHLLDAFVPNLDSLLSKTAVGKRVDVELERRNIIGTGRTTMSVSVVIEPRPPETGKFVGPGRCEGC